MKGTVNEDTAKENGIWQKARKTAQIEYLSPEMATSDDFSKLWRDGLFRRRLGAVIMNEAHCVEEWGVDSFRPQYRALCNLRHFTGQEVPFLACTATCTTRTFDQLWQSLGYGF